MEGKKRIIYYLVVLSIALLAMYFFSPTQSQETGLPDKSAQKGKSSKNAPKTSGRATTNSQKSTSQKKPKPRETRAQRIARTQKRGSEEKTARIETEQYIATISNLNAGIRSFRLKGERYKDKSGNPIDVVSTDKESFYPLGIHIEDLDSDKSALAIDAYWAIESVSKKRINLRYTQQGIDITRKIESGKGPYQLWVTTRISNTSDRTRRFGYFDETHHYVEHRKEKAAIPFMPVRSPAISNGLCLHVKRTEEEELADENSLEMERLDRETLLEPHLFSGQIAFAGVENVYFLNAIAPHPLQDQSTAESCLLYSSLRGRDADGDPLGSLFLTQLAYPTLKLEPGDSGTYRILAYLGPKMPGELSQAGHHLIKAIDLGFFAVLSEGLTWLLRQIDNRVGNWGVAIILLTILVKLILYPLTAMSFKSMAQMRMLKPEMERINEMYKDDREKKGAATMELYRKHKINPMGGCLPVLLQFPIWIALYASLSTNVELFHAPFTLWWTDLSSPDPYFVLPIALGILMFVQQKMTPATMDPVQAKMMLYVMPIMIMSFMLFLPAGLCLYMLTNSVLSIGQQRLTEYKIANMQTATKDSTAEESSEDPEEESEESDSRNFKRIKKTKPKKSQRRSRRGRK